MGLTESRNSTAVPTAVPAQARPTPIQSNAPSHNFKSADSTLRANPSTSASFAAPSAPPSSSYPTAPPAATAAGYPGTATTWAPAHAAAAAPRPAAAQAAAARLLFAAPPPAVVYPAAPRPSAATAHTARLPAAPAATAHAVRLPVPVTRLPPAAATPAAARPPPGSRSSTTEFDATLVAEARQIASARDGALNIAQFYSQLYERLPAARETLSSGPKKKKFLACCGIQVSSSDIVSLSPSGAAHSAAREQSPREKPQLSPEVFKALRSRTLALLADAGQSGLNRGALIKQLYEAHPNAKAELRSLISGPASFFLILDRSLVVQNDMVLLRSALVTRDKTHASQAGATRSAALPRAASANTAPAAAARRSSRSTAPAAAAAANGLTGSAPAAAKAERKAMATSASAAVPTTSEKKIVECMKVHLTKSPRNSMRLYDLMAAVKRDLPGSKEVLKDYGSFDDFVGEKVAHFDYDVSSGAVSLRGTDTISWLVSFGGDDQLPFENPVADLLEQNYQNQGPPFEVEISSDKYPEGTRYLLDAVQMLQTNLDTGFQRQLVRSVKPSQGTATKDDTQHDFSKWHYVPEGAAHVPGLRLKIGQAYFIRHQQERVTHESTLFAMAMTQYSSMMGAAAKTATEPQEVWYLKNETLERRFVERRRQLSPRDTIWVFHGTDLTNVGPIFEDGFKVGGRDISVANGSAFGHGVYTACGPRDPLAYGRNQVVILAMAVKGRHGVSEGWDSWTPPSRPDWVVFKSGDQLLPCFALFW